jgi:adenine-specific DNA-methyltransferase
MATVYWAGAYFGLEQSLWLDALRSAIDELPNQDLRAVGLCGLLHAASYCTSGTGHFAQHRKVTSEDVLRDIAGYRSRSILQYWDTKVRQLGEHLSPPTHTNQVTTRHFIGAVRDIERREVDVIYADPPYSFVHYSRFYHLLETLTLYDRPGFEFDGRYRPSSLRHQSPFSIAGLAPAAFSQLINGARRRGKALVLSYATSGLVAVDDIVDACIDAYGRRHVDVVRAIHTHMTMGRRDTQSKAVNEVVVVCSI